MPYVMVPVPEEHVQEAMEAVLRITRRAMLTEWDAEAVNEFFMTTDEASRSLLSVLARACIQGNPLNYTSAGDQLQVSSREASGIVREINEAVRELDRPPLVAHQEVTESLPNGRTRQTNVLIVPREIATMIIDAEKAELAAAPNPLAKLED